MEEALSDTCGCQSLFCEELGIEDSQEGETGEAEEVKDYEDGEKEDEASQEAPQEEEDTKKVNKADHGGFEQKNRKRTQTEKATEHPENMKEEKDGVEDKPKAVLMSPEAIAQVYSIRGHPESCPVARKKKTRTFYSTDMLEHLEALFQRDHYPDGDKRKVIAASVGLSPQRIMVWFQNRRAKWRKAEGMVSSKCAKQQKRAKWNLTCPQDHLALPNMPAAASSNVGPVFSGHVGAIPPLEPVPPFSTMSTHSLPSCSQMLPTSPGQSRVSEQPNFQPPPLLSPPPLRRASLPLLSYNLNTPMPTPTQPLFMDDRDSHPLQTDGSSQFNFGEELDYLAPGHQSNPQLSFQQQTLYPPGQSQLLPTSMSLPPHMPFPIPTLSSYLPLNLDTISTSLPPHMPFPTPSSYLLPNLDTISTSYYPFGHADDSTAGHNYVQSQGGGPILVQPPNDGVMASYQSYPWPNMYAQPSVGQLAPNYTAGFANAQDLQISSTSVNMPQCFAPAHRDGNPTILPPVSTLQPSLLKDESGMGAEGMAVAPLLPSQASPGSPRGIASPSSDKVENDSPRAIDSQLQCDFSPIQS